jgi:hypothetical protein
MEKLSGARTKAEQIHRVEQKHHAEQQAKWKAMVEHGSLQTTRFHRVESLPPDWRL